MGSFISVSHLSCISILIMLVAVQAFAAKSTISLSINPSRIAFGSVTVGTSLAHNIVILKNGTGNLTVSTATISVAGFNVSGLLLPLMLAPGQSAAFQVAYTPALAGSASGYLYLKKSNGSVLATVALSGTGLAAPPPLDTTAPIVAVAWPSHGATIAGTVLLSANASDNVGVDGVQFYVNGTPIGPQIMAAPYAVNWATTAVSNGPGYAVTATAWDAAGNHATSAAVSVSVSNIVPVQHSAQLAWTASTSSIVGYYVYRATQPGGPYSRASTTADPSTLYTDSTVKGGQLYYYVVTAVDANGVESSHSNEAMAQIPQ